MKRLWTVAAVSATLLVLAACANFVIIPPIISDGVAAHPTGFDPALLIRYHRISEHETEEGEIEQTPHYSGIGYHPRQSGYLGYDNWDVLEVPRDSSGINNWLHLFLSRDAVLVVIWEEYAGWLSGWSQEGEIAGRTVYRRSFGAGEVVLGSPGEENDAYTVLIGESDGQPSSLPPLPAGIDEADRPTTNAACPGWVHNLYLAAGPDGLLYEGWHPQIDTVYWCYFEHEHGSDPSMANYGAAFRYIADKNYGQNEQHEGFKGYVILNVEAETGKRYHWYVNIHSTTSAISRTCARQHTVVIAVVDAQTGELVAELGYKGDYGTVRSNQGDNTLIQPTFSATCPDQQSIDNELEGTGDSFVKRVRVANQAGVSNGGYENWRGGLNTTVGLSYNGSSGLALDIRNPMTSCDTFTCTGAISTGSNATRRTIRFSHMRIDANTDTVQIFDALDGTVDGVFFTDPYGKLPRNEGDPDAIRQYIQPGLDISIDGGFATEDAWRALYVLNAHPEDLELEGSLGSIN